MPSLDDHGQPLAGFCRSRNRQRSIETLIGFVEGIVADGEINDREMLFLDVWLKENAEFLKDDPDAFDLIDAVSDVLADGVITRDEREDLMGLAETILEYRNSAPGSEESAINRLIGIVSGVACDQRLHNAEIEVLSRWLSSNKSLALKWPASAVYDRVRRISSAGMIADDDRQEFLDVLNAIAGSGIADMSASGSTTLPFSNVECVELDGATVCLTGRFIYGTRKECAAFLEEKGAIVINSIKKDLQYLVVGDLVSRDWRFTSYGRKIEKAIQYQENGVQIAIIPEQKVLC